MADGEITEKIKRGWAGRKILRRARRQVAKIGIWNAKILARQWGKA